MQHGAELAQKCTQSEPLRDRDGCPHRAGWRVRDGVKLGCRGGDGSSGVGGKLGNWNSEKLDFWRTVFLASNESNLSGKLSDVQNVAVGVVWRRNFRVWLVFPRQQTCCQKQD